MIAGSPKSAPEHRSLKAGYVWSMAGVGTLALCQWGMVVLLAKFGSMETVGEFALAVAIVAPVIMFANLELRRVLATSTSPSDRLGDYLLLRVATSLLAVALVVAATLSSGSAETLGAVVIAMAVAKGLESISDLLYGFLQRHERIDCVGQSQILRGLLTLGAAGIALTTGSLLWVVLAMGAASLVCLCLLDLPRTAGLRRQVETPSTQRSAARRPAVFRLAWIAWPLGLSAGLTSLSASLPRYFIEHRLGIRALGLFAALSCVMMVGMLASNALVHATIHRFSRLYATDDRPAFLKLLGNCVALCALVGAGAMALAALGGEWILTALYAEEYAAHGSLFTWIAVAFAAQYTSGFLSGAFSAMRHFRAHLLIASASVLVLLALCHVFIDRFGLVGAALAILAAKIFDIMAFGTAIVFLLHRAAHAAAERSLPGVVASS